VQAAGSEAALRRDRLRLVIGFVIDYYRARMRDSAGARQTNSSRASELASHPLLEPLEASLVALEQVDRNANLALVVSYWVVSLSRPMRWNG